ncbi:MAG TPA: flagellar export chaperone FliS [Terracidiphilus sp.]|nr:flagellar export chaperone FliS [Terracidiphilus sp.]
MSTQDSAFAYHQTTALGASPVGQVVALYDTILRDLHRAIAAIEAGRIEKRVNATNHALVVMGELQGVLDFERGGESARNLNNFYNITRAMVVNASVTSSRERLQELVAMFTRLRAAWSHVERTLAPSSQATQEFRISSKPQAGDAQNVGVPQEDEVSGNGGWSA